MATFSAEVTNRANRREHCLVDVGQLESIGCALGQQVRVIKSQDQFALYTVGEVRRERPPTIVRMTAEGRERLGASGEFDAIVDSQITDLIYDDGEAEKLGEFVERLTDDGVHTAMVVIAPHGGLIEEYTDHQAERGLFDLDPTPIRQAINDVFRAVPIEVVFRPRDANDYFSFGGPGALLVSDRRRSCFGLPENIGQRELEELIMTKLCLKIFR